MTYTKTITSQKAPGLLRISGLSSRNLLAIAFLRSTRGITHDEEIYPDPFTFNPSRHLGDDAQPDPYKFVFGFGRRACPGMFSLCPTEKRSQWYISGAHLAEMSLFLNVSNILAVFNISKQVDEHGVEVEPTLAWETGATTLVYDTYYRRVVNLINLYQTLETLPVSNSTSFEGTPHAGRHVKPDFFYLIFFLRTSTELYEYGYLVVEKECDS